MDEDSSPEIESSGIRIGNHALKMGWVTPDQMRQALAEAARDPQGGRTVGLILVAKGFLTGDQLRVLIEREREDTRTIHPSMQGQPFGKYLLRREVGRGAHGVVWEALDTVLGRTVAIKLLRPRGDLAHEEAVVQEERFLREARILAGLPKHPHLVDVYDVGVLDGQWFLAMEFVEGTPMHRWAENVSARARLVLLHDVALAVQHAHEHGILHRDLKPRNILVDKRSRPHITDFGLARGLTGANGESITSSGIVVGTPAYISPEAAKGNREVDGRADVYSLGVIMYEILTGKVPFEGDTAAEVFTKAAHDPVEKPSTTIRGVGLGVDKVLEKICLKALAKKPEDRTPTAQAFAEAIAKWLDASEPRSVVPKVRKDILPKVMGLAILAAFVVGAVIAWNHVEWPKVESPPPPVAPPPPPPVVRPPIEPVKPPPPITRIPPGFTALGRNSQGFEEFWCVKDGSVMVAIPEGEFVMGSEDGEEAERPSLRVYVDAYFLDKTEVTVAQFRRFAEATSYVTEAEKQEWAIVYDRQGRPARKLGASWKSPGFVQTDLHPVTCVSWRDAVAYCTWAGKRLPTEAEWEKGARGVDGRTWPWGNKWEGERSQASRNAGGTVAIGTFASGASPWGVLDMAGNVGEVCADWFDPKFFKKNDVRNPKGPVFGRLRVLKGGSWVDLLAQVRSARRYGAYPDTLGINNADGFRGACDLSKGP